jgi:DNA-binding response OmpR family regulator
MTNKKKILVVEDDPNTQILYNALLGSNYGLLITDNVKQAKDYLKREKVRLIILDLSLKGEEDGLSLARYIRGEKKYSDIVILAVTAHAFVFDKEQCLEAGCDVFLTKPIRGDVLVGHIQNILGE